MNSSDSGTEIENEDFLSDKEFADGILYNGKRMTKLVQKIIKKYERRYSDNESSGLVLSSTREEKKFSDEIIDITEWDDSNFEESSIALNKRIVQIKKEIDWYETESNTADENEVIDLEKNRSSKKVNEIIDLEQIKKRNSKKRKGMRTVQDCSEGMRTVQDCSEGMRTVQDCSEGMTAVQDCSERRKGMTTHDCSKRRKGMTTVQDCEEDEDTLHSGFESSDTDSYSHDCCPKDSWFCTLPKPVLCTKPHYHYVNTSMPSFFPAVPVPLIHSFDKLDCCSSDDNIISGEEY